MAAPGARERTAARGDQRDRSEEHTSELQSHHDLVCRLLLEKKKKDGRLKEHLPYLQSDYQTAADIESPRPCHSLRDIFPSKPITPRPNHKHLHECRLPRIRR